MTAVPFAASLAVTLALLGFVVATGLRAQRRAHLTLVACAVAGLGITIYFAEKLGEGYDLAAAGWVTPLHLTIAKVATAAYLLPVVTGWRTLRDPRFRPWHRRAAYLVLALSVLTAATGTWMVVAAEPLP